MKNDVSQLTEVLRNSAAGYLTYDPIIPYGVLAYEEDTGKMKLGNGQNSYSGLSYLSTGGGSGGGIVEAIIAGDGITVDDTDPANPIITATGGGGEGYTQKSQGVVDTTPIEQDSTFVYLGSPETTIEDPLVDGHVVVVMNASGGAATITGHINGAPDTPYEIPSSQAMTLFCALDMSAFGSPGVITWIAVAGGGSGATVTSVNGETGDVVLTPGDINAAREMGWIIVALNEGDGNYTTLGEAITAAPDHSKIYVRKTGGSAYNEDALTMASGKTLTIVGEDTYHQLNGDWTISTSSISFLNITISGSNAYTFTSESNNYPYLRLRDSTLSNFPTLSTGQLVAFNTSIGAETWNAYRTTMYEGFASSDAVDGGIIVGDWFEAKGTYISATGGQTASPLIQANFTEDYQYVNLDGVELNGGIDMTAGSIVNSRLGSDYGVVIPSQTDRINISGNIFRFINTYDKRGTRIVATNDGTYPLTIDNNHFESDTASGVTDGILNLSTSNAKVTNNLIVTTSKTPSISGIRVTGDRNVISGNTVRTIDTGITVVSGTNNMVTLNSTLDVDSTITDTGTTTVLANNVT